MKLFARGDPGKMQQRRMFFSAVYRETL